MDTEERATGLVQAPAIQNRNQLTVLRNLADSAKPLQSREVQAHCHLTRSEAKWACLYLRDRGYVKCIIKLITFDEGPRFVSRRRTAFWSITETGRKALLVSENK